MGAQVVGEPRAHRAATSMEVSELVGYLQEVLGQRLIAYLAGVADEKAVGKWVRGERRPRSEDRLRHAYYVFHLLQEHESPHTVRAWFVGLNPQLHDESPASAIREGRLKEVLVAAKAYLSGG